MPLTRPDATHTLLSVLSPLSDGWAVRSAQIIDEPSFKKHCQENGVEEVKLFQALFEADPSIAYNVYLGFADVVIGEDGDHLVMSMLRPKQEKVWPA